MFSFFFLICSQLFSTLCHKIFLGKQMNLKVDISFILPGVTEATTPRPMSEFGQYRYAAAAADAMPCSSIGK